MTFSPFAQRFDRLPPSLPLFPLPGVILLPRGQLPLNVFERRYVAMINDCLGGDRLIGMIQPRAGGGEKTDPPLFDVGCAGRVTRFEETGDGRFQIVLTGLCRFTLEAELATTTGYRQARAGWSRFETDYAEPPSSFLDRPRLLAALKPYFAERDIQVDWEALHGAKDDQVLTSLAMGCPFEPEEKQALVEAADVDDRAELLLGLIDMARAMGGDPGLKH